MYAPYSEKIDIVQAVQKKLKQPAAIMVKHGIHTLARNIGQSFE